MSDEPLMSDEPRTRAERRRDTEHRLANDADIWVASASPGGTPYLVPLSFDWDGEAVLVATPPSSPTGRNLAVTRRARLGLGGTRDVTVIDGEVEVIECAGDRVLPCRPHREVRVAVPPRVGEAGSMPSRLILWDIDGTLLTTGPVGRLALELGACRAAGLDEVPQVAMGGKTDPQIMRELLTLAGLAPPDVDVLLPVALEEAERILAAESSRIREEGTVHPGVTELLEALSGIEGVRQTLLTGNIAPNALVKVGAFGLDRYLDPVVGAYGTDHPERDGLVPIALDRARERRGERYLPAEVWVIGDTVRDLQCARAGGVRCLIVGTGREGFDAVRALEADALVEDLADTDLVLKLLLDDPPGRESAGRPPSLFS